MKTTISVYYLRSMNTIYLSHSTHVAEETLDTRYNGPIKLLKGQILLKKCICALKRNTLQI